MFKIVTNPDDLIKVFIIRGIVFMDEQKVAYSIEMDEYEYSALHILGEINGEPVAAGRIRFIGEWAKLERIAVRKEFRNHGYGHKIVEYMLQIARERGFRKFKMHAQSHLCEYYTKHGFKVTGKMFKEANIDHFLMVLKDNPI
ncbi:MAG: GNAT family N-acetyltransferase [Candidatus Marinimicrobia bacterium]|jgi:predicted GNAT family N-acyltransferase|nr:GNAT family N-acetyltransferase [Candidatus Neomarinimicrobiota bacterium]